MPERKPSAKPLQCQNRFPLWAPLSKSHSETTDALRVEHDVVVIDIEREVARVSIVETKSRSRRTHRSAMCSLR